MVRELRDFLVMVRDGRQEDSPWIIMSSGHGRSCQLFTLSEAAAETARHEGYMVRIVRVYRGADDRLDYRYTIFPPAREEMQRYKYKLRVRRSHKSVDEPASTVPDYQRDVVNEGAGEAKPSVIPETDPIPVRGVVSTATTVR